MPYRLAILAVALVLAGTGLWLLILHVSTYTRIGTDDNDGVTAHKWRLNEKGVPELYLCNNLMCKSYSEIRWQYAGYFAIDAIVFSAAAGLVAFLFAWRRRTKAQSII
ncbi:hypothetical protein NTE_01039 [Candidatus Nitrososphaera evergladensis SR1]|jgi:hypothetical protein|uniref:Uncharacterized protein n=1 Tax=Candidatus Nitrososphaera evergladensis SR1 TaxID=1459636 RepID=A0A075MPH2_9ARCH|nr:hypothetical protein [Candidatus Nitrososphaera evergladensis]AIF83113.1 hypothetical protein NTE_01039 [Candidatus Nitrososphaera evergladensis SR1]